MTERANIGESEARGGTTLGSWNSMQTTTDDTSLAFCQMMQAKDVQIRRLVLRMERCATAPVKSTATACQHAELLLCWPAHSMQLQQTNQKLEHAKSMNDGVQKHSRLFRRADELVIECRRASEENHHLKREVTKHRAALADARSIIDDLQDALLARGAGPPVASSAATPPREATPLHTAAQSLSRRAETDRDWPEGGLGREEPKQRHAVFVRAAKSHGGLSAPSPTDACDHAEGAVRPVSPQLSPASASSSSNLGMESPPLAWSPSPCRSFDEGSALGPTVTRAPLSLPAAEQAQLAADAAPSASSASASRKTAAVAGGGLSVARENARPRRQTTNSACLREPSLGSKLRQGDSFTFGTPRPGAVRRPTQGAKVHLSKAGEDAGVPEAEDGTARVKSDATTRKWGAAAQGRSSVLEHMFR